MDHSAFDRLTRQFGSSKSRRGTLRAALGLVLGGAVIGRSSDALAADDDELAGEAVAGGRGSLGDLGGGSGGKRKGSNRNRGKGGDKDRKQKRRDECAKAGQKRKRGKPCCKGLDRDSVGRCIKRQPEGSAGGCDPNSCPSDPATKKRGFCCPGGYCSCGGQCCPECGIESKNFGDDINAQLVSEREVCCTTCSDSGDTCCAGCVDGNCIFHTPFRGGSVRRR